MKNILITIFTVFCFTAVQGQEKSNKIIEASFEVKGVCGMCEKRIESAAMRTKGVKTAEWDKETKLLKVVYNSKKTEELAIHESIASYGHETEGVKADSSSYAKLPDCCRYKHGAKCND